MKIHLCTPVSYAQAWDHTVTDHLFWCWAEKTCLWPVVWELPSWSEGDLRVCVWVWRQGEGGVPMWPWSAKGDCQIFIQALSPIKSHNFVMLHLWARSLCCWHYGRERKTNSILAVIFLYSSSVDNLKTIYGSTLVDNSMKQIVTKSGSVISSPLQAMLSTSLKQRTNYTMIHVFTS